MIEFTSQLNQSILGWDWSKDAKDFPTFLENTLRLLGKYEQDSSSLFGLPGV